MHRRKKNKSTFFPLFQIFDFESLGSIATEILSLKWGAVVWYADQSRVGDQKLVATSQQTKMQGSVSDPKTHLCDVRFL